MSEYNGVINVYKEKGYTSHDVVAIIRRLLSRVKTGHTGTLDPDAEGVLLICVGKATKLADKLTSENKRYTARVNLGVSTDTYDSSGKVTKQKEVNAGREEIMAAVASFSGVVTQTPPMYSAIKINGKKLYELARKGIEIERKPREITIFDIQLLEFLSDTSFVIDVSCSKGTYIRSLCHDIGEKLGCGAHMSELVRTQSGGFLAEDSRKLDEIKAACESGQFDKFIIPIDDVLCRITSEDPFQTR